MKPREFTWSGSNSGGRTLRHNSHKREDVTSPKLPARKGGALQLLTRPRENEPSVDKDDSSAHDVSRLRESVANVSLRDSNKPVRSSPNTSVEAKPDKGMNSAKKLINDCMHFEDFLNEYLTDNTNFDIIGAIGPQGAGKSTILSMLGGNDSQDMYRHYVFRPASREAIESSRYQTIKIFAYVSKSRTIFLDCQATNCSSILEESLRHYNFKTEERMDVSNNVESIELLALLLQVCQTVLVCTDWLFDLELIKMIRLAEGIRATNININGLPTINTDRRVNLVFLLTRAKSNDFSKSVLASRIRIIRGLFKDSKRIRIPDDDLIVLVPLADIKPRKDTLTVMHAVVAHDRAFVSEEVEEFEKSLRQLRNRLSSLEKDPFSLQSFSEKNWFNFTRAVWKDSAFLAALEYYRTSVAS